MNIREDDLACKTVKEAQEGEANEDLPEVSPRGEVTTAFNSSERIEKSMKKQGELVPAVTSNVTNFALEEEKRQNKFPPIQYQRNNHDTQLRVGHHSHIEMLIPQRRAAG